ncbi:MAG: hypothetical protein VW912_07675 [Flavobacteriaceae bacterium]
MKYTQPTLLWKEVMPAITTQFSLSGELDLKVFTKNLNTQVTTAVGGMADHFKVGLLTSRPYSSKNKALN